jgi:hypothetical protein
VIVSNSMQNIFVQWRDCLSMSLNYRILSLYIFCKKANSQSDCIQFYANIFVQWREPLIIEKNQCIIKKQIRKVVYWNTCKHFCSVVRLPLYVSQVHWKESMYIFCKKEFHKVIVSNSMQNIFVQWREPLIIEKNQCIIKKQIRKVVYWNPCKHFLLSGESLYISQVHSK